MSQRTCTTRRKCSTACPDTTRFEDPGCLYRRRCLSVAASASTSRPRWFWPSARVPRRRTPPRCSSSTTAPRIAARKRMGSPHTTPACRCFVSPATSARSAALRRGFRAATSDFVIVPGRPDLEYDPRDWATLLEPLVNGRADAVYGSGFGSGRRARARPLLLARRGNRFLTLVFERLHESEPHRHGDRLQGLPERSDPLTRSPRGRLRRRARNHREAGAPERAYTKLRSATTAVPMHKVKDRLTDRLRALWCIVRYSRAGDAVVPLRQRQPAGEEAADEEAPPTSSQRSRALMATRTGFTASSWTISAIASSRSAQGHGAVPNASHVAAT